ncbi:MFS transporter [Parahaliea sp. F7430]|uniref:MFS transporter n=1 Tax=Sediminihaliea albiluteola TaxID=2758564 RepID=A0A7W2YJH3_9GAMM|nr:MFS transporter [Sediminihaliea albiluteola]MBA6413120.1 MFS transporter [Sediminihaliea albiluteola]
MTKQYKQLDIRQTSVLIMGLMATGIGQSLVFAILAPLGREVALSELQITSIIAVSALIFALASPHWGRVSDRVGRKPIIITGLAGYTVGTVLFTSVLYAGLAGMMSGLLLYAVLMITRCSQSIIMSATGPASTAYAADNSSPSMRTKTMARLGTANSMGMILGPAVSGALATFGLLAPLYFAAGLSALAGFVVWRMLPPTPKQDLTSRNPRKRLRFTDPRIRHYLAGAVGLFIGFSAIQQTLGFLLQDKLSLSGIETAQLTGAALMISALFTFNAQVTLMQRLRLRATQFLRLGLLSLLIGACIVAGSERFAVLAVGMAFMGNGLGLAMPAVAAGASLAVSTEEQGAVAGMVSACPAMGFVVGPICAGALYQIHGPLAALFSAGVFLLVLVVLSLHDRHTHPR